MYEVVLHGEAMNESRPETACMTERNKHHIIEKCNKAVVTGSGHVTMTWQPVSNQEDKQKGMHWLW